MKIKQRKTHKIIALLLSVLMITGPVFADGLVVNGGTVTLNGASELDIIGGVDVNSGSLTATGASNINLTGGWEVAGAGFTAGTSTVTFMGTSSATLNAGTSSFNNLVMNKTGPADANDNLTVITNPLTIGGTTTLTDGEIIQGTTNFTLTGGLTVAAAAEYTNSSTGDLTMGGAVANAGMIVFDSSGGGGGDADDILIRSTVGATQRNWQGAGTFSMTDVDVQDQTALGGTPPSIFVASGTDTGNNINWFFTGALTFVDVEPASLVASAEGDVDVTFTLANAWPANGKLVIDFGSGFNAAALAVITNILGADGGYAVVLSSGDGTNDIVTLTRDATGTALAGGTAITLRLENEVTNPAAAGPTGVYTLTTQLNDTTAIDSGTAASDTIISGLLAGVSVVPDSTLVGAVTNATVTFTTANAWPSDGKLTITFPAGFDLTTITGVSSAADISGGLSFSVSGQTLTITRNGFGAIIPGGTTIDDLIISGLQNPVSPGAYGVFTVNTTTAADVVIDTGTAPVIVVGANDGLIFLTLAATPTRVRIGDVVNFTATIKNQTSADLQDFDLVHQFPPGLTLLAGSARGSFTSSQANGTQELFVDFDRLPAGTSAIVTYQAIINSNASTGTLQNTAFVQINPIISNTALVSIEIIPDLIFQLGTLIGKVFWDKNLDGMQQEGEPGLPDVRVATEEGVVVTTDSYGRYHIPDVGPGRHYVKIDSSSLPDGTEMTTNKTVLIHATDAMLNKANFGVLVPEGSALSNLKTGAEGEVQEPIQVSVRNNFTPVIPQLNLEFNAFSQAPQNFSMEEPGALWQIPFNPQTNFPLFVKDWSLELIEMDVAAEQAQGRKSIVSALQKKDGVVAEEFQKVIASQKGRGPIPSLVMLDIKADDLLSNPNPKQLVFTVWDKEGHYAKIKYQIQVAQNNRTIDLVLINSEPQESDIKLTGSSTVIEGEAPLTHRIEVFGVPVPVDTSGHFSAEFAMPQGRNDIPILVYPGGFDPVSQEIIPVEPVKVYRSFEAEDNYFYYVGFGDLEIGGLDFSGSKGSLSAQDLERQEGSIYSDHRLAYYLKGKFKGKYLLTASIDTEREKKELFRVLEPENYYATYGDDSALTYDATDTQDEVFFMLEAEQSHLRYGNFNTGFSGTEYANFERTLHGYRAHYQSTEVSKDTKPKTVVSGFKANARQRSAHNEFSATGGSLFYLKHRRVVQGGEHLKIEVRDPITGVAVTQTPLVNGVDYDIDYDQGRIRLYRPLHMLGDSTGSVLFTNPLQGQPNILVVDYEYESADIIKDQSQGLRLTKELLPGFRLGGTYVEEQKIIDEYQMKGLDAYWNLGDRLELWGEVATSSLQSQDQFVSGDGGLSFFESTRSGPGTDGLAYKTEMRTTLWDGMTVTGFYRYMDRDYASSSALSQAGAEKYGVAMEQLIGTWGRIYYQHYNEHLIDGGTVASDDLGTNKISVDQLQFQVMKGRWTVTTEYRHGSAGQTLLTTTPNPASTNTVQQPQNPLLQGTVIPMEDEELIGAEIKYALTEKTDAIVGAQTNLTGEPNSQLRTGLVHRLNQTTQLLATHVVGSRGNAVALGAQSVLFGNQLNLFRGFGQQSLINSAMMPAVQETTLGYVKQIGEGTNASVKQGVTTNGVGSSIFSLNKATKNTFYDVSHQAAPAGQGQMTTFASESKLTENSAVYTSTSIMQAGNAVNTADAYNGAAIPNSTVLNSTGNTTTVPGLATGTSGASSAQVTTVRGIKADVWDKRLSLYRENANSSYMGSRRWDNRMGGKLFVTPEFSFDLGYEKGQTQTGIQDIGHQAGRGMVDFNRFGFLTYHQDFEFRVDDSALNNRQMLSTGQTEVKLNPEWTVLGRYEWSQTKDVTSIDKTAAAFSEYQTGLAYRPVKADWLNLLGEYKKIGYKGPGSQIDINSTGSENSQVYRAEVALDINRFITLVEKIATRRSVILANADANNSVRSTTNLWANRLNFHLTQWMDFIAEYRYMHQDLADDVRHGFLTEISVKPLPGLRVGVGYNSLKYDARTARDLDLETHGFYTRIMYDVLEAAEEVNRRNHFIKRAAQSQPVQKLAGFWQRITQWRSPLQPEKPPLIPSSQPA